MLLKTREIVSRAYDHIEAALWAILFAFVIYFIAFDAKRFGNSGAKGDNSGARNCSGH
jgi:hypothetical protein